MQIQSASIPSASAKPVSQPKQTSAAIDVPHVKATPTSENKPDARSVSQDKTETASNAQFAPVSAPIASTNLNASYAATRDGATATKPINQYQQMAQQGLTNETNGQSDLFGVDVYV